MLLGFAVAQLCRAMKKKIGPKWYFIELLIMISCWVGIGAIRLFRGESLQGFALITLALALACYWVYVRAKRIGRAKEAKGYLEGLAELVKKK